MTQHNDGGPKRGRRHLSPSEKLEVWQQVVAGNGSQREIADRWGIDRSTVVAIVKAAKEGALERLSLARPGRPSKSTAEIALEEAQAEIARLKETVTEQAVELHLHRGKGRWG